MSYLARQSHLWDEYGRFFLKTKPSYPGLVTVGFFKQSYDVRHWSIFYIGKCHRAFIDRILPTSILIKILGTYLRKIGHLHYFNWKVLSFKKCLWQWYRDWAVHKRMCKHILTVSILKERGSHFYQTPAEICSKSIFYIALMVLGVGV